MNKKSKMHMVGYGAVLALVGAIKVSFRILAFTGKVLGKLVVPPIAALIASMAAKQQSQVRKGPAQENTQPVKVQVQLAQDLAANAVDTGPATIIRTSEFEGCDRIVSIRLDPPVGVINLRVFYNAGVVKRDLIISEPYLKAMMRGRRHNFPDVDYDAVAGLDEIKDETIALAEKLINDLGNKAVKATKPRKDDFVRAKAAQTTAPQVQAPVREAPKPEPVPVASQPNPAPPVAAPAATAKPAAGRTVAPMVTTGFTYQGRLTKAGPQIQRPPNKRSFEVFEATIQLDNGAELALRGAELERELLAAGVQLGNRVAITPMGKVPVQLANGEEGKKNLYRVENLARK